VHLAQRPVLCTGSPVFSRFHDASHNSQPA
jgi:hypothetical protein